MTKIAVKTDKPAYVEGDTVTGNVYLDIPEDTPSTGILLVVKGFEKVSWTDMYRKRIPPPEGSPPNTPPTYEIITMPRRAKRTFFKDQMKVGKFDGAAPAGQYTFPFQYALADELPGSFEHKQEGHEQAWYNFKGYIKYKIRAVLDRPIPEADAEGGDEEAKMKDSQRIVVNERLDFDLKPEIKQVAAQVKFLCCIPKGMCTLRAWFDKIAFMPGETANITTEVLNESSSAIDHLIVKMFRTIKFADRHGKVKFFRTLVSSAAYEGLSPEEAAGKPTPLLIKEDSMSSVRSQFISCTYHVEIECDIPYAPDIAVGVPVTVYSPQPANWGTEPWFPPVPLAVEYAPDAIQIVPVKPHKIPQKPAVGADDIPAAPPVENPDEPPPEEPPAPAGGDEEEEKEEEDSEESSSSDDSSSSSSDSD